jgi:hypothetical protein
MADSTERYRTPPTAPPIHWPTWFRLRRRRFERALQTLAVALLGAVVALSIAALGRRVLGRSPTPAVTQARPQQTAEQPNAKPALTVDPPSGSSKPSTEQPNARLNPASPPAEPSGGIQPCPENPGYGWIWYAAGDENRPSWHLEKLPAGYRPRDPYAGIPFLATPEAQRQFREQEAKEARQKKLLDDVQRRFREAMPPEEPENRPSFFGVGP